METSITEVLISVLIGGVVGTYLEKYLSKKHEKEAIKNDILIKNYKNILIFMSCALDSSNKDFFQIKESVPFQSEEEYLKQINEYYYHQILHSSDDVILSLKEFIKEPNKQNFHKTAVSMRQELWDKKTNLNFDDIIIDPKNN